MRSLLFCGFVVLCLFTGNNVLAQSSIGIKLGMGISMPSVTVKTDRFDNWSPENKYGIVFGMFAQVPLQGQWVFVPAAQFSSKGLKERHVSAMYNYNFTITKHFSYLDLPLNFVHSSKAKGNGFQIGGGPVVSFLLNDGYRSYPVKSLDFGVNGLLGYQTPIGFSVQLNYTFGVADVGENLSNVPHIRNRFLALSVGYLF
jgi:hypothetical protein